MGCLGDSFYVTVQSSLCHKEEKGLQMNQAEAIEKIKKCLAFARGGIEECATAAYQAQKLAARYGIDEALLLIDKVELPANETIVEKQVFTFDGPRVVTWVLNLGTALASVNNCKLWFTTYGNRDLCHGRLTAAGRESDLSTITYMLSYLTQEIEDISKREAKMFRETNGYSGGKNWSNSFKVGCVSMVYDRLKQARDKAIEDARASAVDVRDQVTSVQETGQSDGTPVVKYELAVIDNAIQLWGNRKKRAEEWVKQHHKLHTSNARVTSLHGGAWHAGREAGGRIALNSGPRLTG